MPGSSRWFHGFREAPKSWRMRFGKVFVVHELEVIVGVDPADRVSRRQSSGLMWDEVGASKGPIKSCEH